MRALVRFWYQPGGLGLLVSGSKLRKGAGQGLKTVLDAPQHASALVVAVVAALDVCQEISCCSAVLMVVSMSASWQLTGFKRAAIHERCGRLQRLGLLQPCPQLLHSPPDGFAHPALLPAPQRACGSRLMTWRDSNVVSPAFAPEAAFMHSTSLSPGCHRR